MPSPSSRARGTLARDTKPELSLSPTEETRVEGTVVTEAARHSEPRLGRRA